MAADLHSLLGRRALGLRLVSSPGELPDGWQTRTVPWVHSSDLADPTPFLAEGHVLLTTGTQFGGPDAPGDDEADAYAGRLAAHGIAGLGFGTEVVRSGVPDALERACRRHGLPLFEVPYRTPFIAVVQANAEELSREAHARSEWALAAQRAISLAALRPDGLAATLTELSRQLNGWVGLFDARGALQREAPSGALTTAQSQTIRREAARLLARGHRAGATTDAGDQRFTLQTLGSSHRLRGVLALAASEQLDRAGREVLTSVIAMAGLALEQNRDLGQARRLLRSGLLQLLLGGEHELVERISQDIWGPLPAAPLRVAEFRLTADAADALAETLELRVQDHPGTLFFARRDDAVVLVVVDQGADDAELVAQLTEDSRRFHARAGLSARADYADIRTALDQASLAADRASESGAALSEFEELTPGGLLAYLAATDARTIARAVLAPLAEHDAAHRTELVQTLRCWLERGCEYDATARALGIHRHTARARIEQAGRILGRDLGSFPARAELWAALVADSAGSAGRA